MSEIKKTLLGLFRSGITSARITADSRTPEQEIERERERELERELERDYERERRYNRQHERRPRRFSTTRSRRRLSRFHDDHRRSSPRRSTTPPSAPPSTLTAWPPEGIESNGSLTLGKAMELVANGVPVFKGIQRQIPHASDKYYTLYVTVEGNRGAGGDHAEPFNTAFMVNSFRLQGSDSTSAPWETLEQPSLEFHQGYRQGTITLNYWVGLFNKPSPAIELREIDMRPRDMKFSDILGRIVYIEANGIEEDDPDLMYRTLYKAELKDPDKIFRPRKAMEKQIADLIIILSRPEWIDFSQSGNQVVAKFFANASYTDQGRYKLFFHQLLLCLELYLRIQSKNHSEWAKEKLFAQLPPCIAWDMALAGKWLECMSIEDYDTGSNPEQVQFRLKAKSSQVKALRKFARVMKWPNLVKVDGVLKEQNSNAKSLEDRSSDTMSYFTGMILPGATLPWLIMNSLIDCDDDVGANRLAALTHMSPNSGFQYKGTTYWSSTCIVGKVLAPTCKEISGWVGPVRPTPDLPRIGIARIRQRRPKQYVSKDDIADMAERSRPLGLPPKDSKSYFVSEYELLLPDSDDYYDVVRIENLALKPAYTEGHSPQPTNDQVPTYEAAILFAIEGRSWPLRLSYDVSFITSYPCALGPHPLFYDYEYTAVKVADILTIRHWGCPSDQTGSALAPSGSGTRTPNDSVADRESEKVLVIEAFGPNDNEVLARAWCSHWGLSAIIADIDKTCMACTIREAYAACVNVAILVQGPSYVEERVTTPMPTPTK